MESSLLCDEVLWLSSPPTDVDHDQYYYSNNNNNNHLHNNNFHITKEDCEQALKICLEQENIYVPKPNYIQYLLSNNYLVLARFKIIKWFVKCQIRLSLSFETILYATNYLDRFLSMNLYNEWKDWMIELLAIGCLSIACKYDDTEISPTLNQINQMMVEDVLEYHYLFEANTIQKMEMVILKALDWRLGFTTSHSFVEMFAQIIFITFKPYEKLHIINQLNDFLLRAVSDIKMLEFNPSIVGLSALWCCSHKLHDLTISSIITNSSLKPFFTQHQKEDLARCHELMKMEDNNIDNRSLYNFVAKDWQYNCQSPTTVLLKDHIILCDFHFDLSLFHIISGHPNSNPDQSRSRKKRRNEGYL